VDSLRSLWHSPLALQRLSSALVWAAGLSLVLGLGHWLASRPAFALRMVEVQAVGAPMRHVQEADIRLAFANGLSGTTLTAPLHEIQSRLAAHPWVRQVSIRRIWPNRLLVRVEEHQPLASSTEPLTSIASWRHRRPGQPTSPGSCSPHISPGA
jgi:cell division protein FtsQ